MQYVAFLRGINVGPQTKVGMKELKAMLEKLGYTDVKTVLNSGNVVFTTDEKDNQKLKQHIETELEQTFGFPITVLLRTEQEIGDLSTKDPFKKLSVTSTMRLNVTFLSEPSKTTVTSHDDFQIVASYSDAICSVVDLNSGKGTPDLMNMLQKTYGKNITTRTWTTIQRIGKLLA